MPNGKVTVTRHHRRLGCTMYWLWRPHQDGTVLICETHLAIVLEAPDVPAPVRNQPRLL